MQVRKDPLKAAEYFRRATEAAPNFAPALEAYGHFLHKCSPLALSPTPPYPALP
jgi:Tfp pilus assembly protein PilF